MKQQIEVAGRTVGVEKANAGPDFSIGYFNQSIRGFQNINGQNIYSGPGDRFSGFQAGIQIPLFFSAYSNRIKAAKTGARIAATQYSLYETNVKGQYQQAVEEYLKQLKSMEYYEQNALPNADFLRKQSQAAFTQGEIQYVELLQALRTYSEIRSNYLQTVNQFNQSIIELQYLSGQTINR